jgi:anti-sigma factor RsiW
MNDLEHSCPIADADTEVRYLAGLLSPAEAEAFEEHYFECDICWRAVQQGTEIRSALAQPSLPASKAVHVRRSREWWPLLVAASVMIIAVWRFPRPVESDNPNLNVGPVAEPVRGAGASALISAAATDKALTASWARNTDARSYRVRLLAEDGQLLLDREVTDTSIVVPLDSITRLGSSGAIYWQVDALNDLRVVVSSYPLKEALLVH